MNNFEMIKSMTPGEMAKLIICAEQILDKYNALKIKYDRYDDICYDYAFIGFALGIIITLIIEYFLTK